MGKIKNFRVNLPYEYAKDKKWIDENIKPGDVEEYRVYRGEIELTGSMEMPEELLDIIHELESNQAKIEAKLDLLFSMLSNLEVLEERSSQEEVEEDSSSVENEDLQRRRLKFYKVLEEVERMGKGLRTTELKELGGKYSTAVSYSYELFKGWRDALSHYRAYRETQTQRETERGAVESCE